VTPCIQCSGVVVEPEAVKKFFTAVRGLHVPADGEILPAGTYQQFLRDLPAGSASEG
jgi:hypothetical protein